MSHPANLSFCLCLMTACGNAVINNRTVEKKTLFLGYMVPWTNTYTYGSAMGGAIVPALQEVKRRQLLPDYDIEFVFRDSQCNNRVGIKMAIDIWSSTNKSVVGFIADGCSVVCEPVSLLNAAWNLPMVAYACGGNILSDKKVHPTFSRVLGSFEASAPSFYKVARMFGWRRIAIITQTADVFSNLARKIRNLMEERLNATVLYFTVPDTLYGDKIVWKNIQTIRYLLREIKHNARVILTLSYPQEKRNLLVLAQEEGMMDGTFAYISDTNIVVGKDFTEPPDHFRPNVGQEIFEGQIIVTEYSQRTEGFSQFQKDTVAGFSNPQFKGLDAFTDPDLIPTFAATIYNAVLVWAYGANKTINEGYPVNDGVRVTRNIFNLSVDTITGTIHLDSHGDRIPDFRVFMVQNNTRTDLAIIKAYEILKLYKPESEDDWTGLVWPGGGSTIPLDTPPCQRPEAVCDSSRDGSHTITVACAAVAMVITTVATLIIYFKYRKKKILKETLSYVIPATELIYTDTKKKTPSQLSLPSAISNDTDIGRGYGDTVRYKNHTVAVYRLGQRPVYLNDDMLNEIKAMLHIKHDNVNQFVGICLDPQNVCILMQYAARASLQDIIYTRAVNFTWDFKLSLIYDIAQGMKYLHSSSIGPHGHLTSTSCVVDSRWICKISDYGFIKLKTSNPISDEGIPANMLLWTAPEHLRSPAPAGTKPADVFSFGIIVQEVTLENTPYCLNHPSLEPEDIIEKVKQGIIPPYRPNINQDDVSLQWSQLMVKCWSEMPTERPDFSTVCSMISAINGGKELSLVDSMIQRLEIHTEKLEIIVSERSMLLRDEKQKMEHLLRELLPSSVAENLQAGRSVLPEMFDDVTIFFSDIVGFTRISAAGTPIDVVRMLNMMYTTFDDVSSNYDVYKVATIGDAYFVVSGAPIRNGNRHAGEISKMALALLQAVKQIRVPHIPDETLSLRIGIHSGPCVAGVAGIKMPRYLLFGDTVDIASHMESGGERMRIHISQTTMDRLLQAGGFRTELRGVQVISGLGTTTTYWLLGQI